MNNDLYSSDSSESEMLQKLGFDNRSDNRAIYASILNRLRTNLTILPVIMEIISYIQICAIGFYITIPGLFSDSKYTKFIHLFLERSLDLSKIFEKDDRDESNTYLMIFYALVLFIWLLFYLIFILQYKTTQSYKAAIVNIVYFVGFHVIGILSSEMGTTAGHFCRSLFEDVSKVDALPTFFSIIFIFIFMFIDDFMVKVVQSSPDANSHDLFCFWPTNYIQALYRRLVGFFLPLLLELLRDHGETARNIGFSITIVCGIVGLILLWKEECSIFPNGLIILSVEYVILVFAPILSMIHEYQKINSLYYLLAFLILVVGSGIGLHYLNAFIYIKRIDVLYLPIIEIPEHISSPTQCINFLKIGILYKAPCIKNFKLQDWAVTNWPNHKKLLLMVGYISYLYHMPYLAIINLIYRSVSISPLNEYENLLYSQLFNKLPIHEHLLKSKLESLRRLYELPISSLKNFWRAVLVKHWDEALLKTISFQKDADRITMFFSNIIFEHPYSESVTKEFAQFTIQIQGNYALAHLIEKEMENRAAFIQMITNENQDQNNKVNQNAPLSFDSGSLKFSNLSSIKSSLLFSDFSDVPEGFEKSQGEIQSAVNARPIFYPTYFFIAIIAISIFSLAAIVSSFVVANIETSRLDSQMFFAARIHQLLHVITQILFRSIEFTTLDKLDNETISGKANDVNYQRSDLNNLTQYFGELLVNAFKYHNALPDSSLEFWVNEDFLTYILFPIYIESLNMTIMESIRIYQIKARTLAFSSLDYLGTIENPCKEILQVTYLYPTVAKNLNTIMKTVSDISNQEINNNRLKVILSISICLGLSFVSLIISAPIIIIGLIKEYNFFLSLYSMIPANIIISNILKEISFDSNANNNNNNANNNNNNNANNNNINSSKTKINPIENNKKIEKEKENYLQLYKYNYNLPNSQKLIKLPLRLYHVISIIAVFLCIFIITPIPFVMIIFSYIYYVDESHFILNGLCLTSEMTSSFGMLSLYTFRLVSEFPSPLSRQEEVEQYIIAADTMLDKYSNLYLGDSELFKNGLITRKESEEVKLIPSDETEECRHLVGFYNAEYNCIPSHEQIHFLYGLCKRLIELEESNSTYELLSIENNSTKQNSEEEKPKGITSKFWRLFYPTASYVLDFSTELFYQVFYQIFHLRKNRNKILTIVSLLIGILLFVLSIILTHVYIKQVLIKSFKSILRPIVIMNPTEVMESPFLLRFLQGDFDSPSRERALISQKSSNKFKSKKDSNLETEGGSMIDFIVEGVLALTADGTIIASNKRFHEIFCNTSEEVIGMNIRSVFIQSLDPLMDLLDDIKLGKSNFEQNKTIDTVLFSEDGQQLKVKVSLIAELNQNQRGGRSTICTLIFKDESEIIKTQNKLTQEKEKVERILNIFIPNSLVNSFLKSDEDIYFEVENACVLYSHLVINTSVLEIENAKVVMNALNLIFTEFDLQLNNFPTITKLKTTDGDYICVSGIFRDSTESLEKSAVELLSFAIKMKELILKGILINETRVQIKVGIYTGGPFSCGIVGTELPSFEVIGKGFSLANELQKTCTENQIHICNTTAKMTQSLALDLEEIPNNGVIQNINGSTWMTK